MVDGTADHGRVPRSTPDSLRSDGRAVHFRRADVMAEYMLSNGSVGAYPDSLNAVLDEIEQRGGATLVLRELGLSEAELEALRQRSVRSSQN